MQTLYSTNIEKDGSLAKVPRLSQDRKLDKEIIAMTTATVETAQQELATYLETQARSVAPARIDRNDIAYNYTYLSAQDEDSNNLPVRLIILLEDCLDNERLVDLVTNNDSFAFIYRLIRNNFDREWRIADTWNPVEDCPF